MNAQHIESESSQRMGLESDQDGSSHADQKAAGMNMQPEQHPQSYLFTLRVWEEGLGEGKAEWRGRVLEIAGGEALFFRDWPGLVAALERLIAKSAASRENSPGQPLFTHENDE